MILVPQFFAREFFQTLQGLLHLLFHSGRHGATLQELAARFRLYGETRRDGKTSIGHFGESGTLAAELGFHGAIAFSVTVGQGEDKLSASRFGLCRSNLEKSVHESSPLSILGYPVAPPNIPSSTTPNPPSIPRLTLPHMHS